VIVGSGFVGGEVATTASHLGLDVTVIEAAGSPIGGALGDEVGSLLAAAYQRLGIDLRLGARVDAIESRAIALADGARLPYDVALVGVGVEPARELAVAGDLLAGDVTGTGHWAAASEQGAAAAQRLLGLPVGPAQPPYVWSDQLGYRLQVVGRTGAAALVDLDGDETSFVARYLDEHGGVLGAVAANRPAATAGLRQELAAVPSAA
jgi:NADPH-dependent 2,4-dienoyl-CoA reductase/sulfur reductase-like enzyme